MQKRTKLSGEIFCTVQKKSHCWLFSKYKYALQTYGDAVFFQKEEKQVAIELRSSSNREKCLNEAFFVKAVIAFYNDESQQSWSQ